MPGLTKGEASSATNPALQLFTRSGKLLQDAVSGTYQIFRLDAVSNVEVVPEAAFNFADAPTGHKLGTGRLYVPTGDTSAWTAGSYLAICRYLMAAGGRSYVQETYFEVFEPETFPTGYNYISYASPRVLMRKGLLPATGSIADYQQLLFEISQHLEQALHNHFEPRYYSIDFDAIQSEVLQIDKPIIAVEKVEVITEDISGFDYDEIDSGGYRVYNRHLDGLLQPDDRHDPKVSRESFGWYAGIEFPDSGFPRGRQIVRVTGVFGYTDPAPQSDKVLIGTTPKVLERAIVALATRYLEDPSLSDPAVQQPGRVASYRTRHQSISFHNAAGSVTYTDGLTGDPLLDQQLMRLRGPIAVAVLRMGGATI